MTVAEVGDDGVQCLWLGEEGELFRETLPESVLELVPAVSAQDDDEDENNDEADADDEDDEDDEGENKKKKSAARKVA